MAEHPRIPFEIPGTFDANAPMSDFHAYEWGNTQANRRDVTVKNYLQSLGFVIGSHVITPEQHDILSNVIDHWHRTTARFAGKKFSDCLVPAGKDGFYFWNDGKRYEMTPAFRAALIDAGWIYDPKPENTLFRLHGNRLYAQYQQIIGSRLMARLDDRSE